jgi:hypothetical protein
MTCVDEQHFEAVLENIEHGLPVHPGRFHSNMGYAVFFQPCLEAQKIVGHGAIRSDFFFDARSHNARHNAMLMHIETSTFLNYGIHATPPLLE